MKKIPSILLLLVLLAALLLLVACDGTEGNGGKGDGDADQPTSAHWELSLTYYLPGDTTGTKFTYVTGSEGISVTAASVAEMNYYNYAGLFTEPHGGTMVFDKDGKYTGAALTESGRYYVQGTPADITIKWGAAVDAAAHQLPTSLPYGSPFLANLPILSKEGVEFLGWYATTAMQTSFNYDVHMIAGPDGVVFDQYRSLNTTAYKINVERSYWTNGRFDPDNAHITGRSISVYPKFTGSETGNIQVTFQYNDGTYRMTSKSYGAGVSLASVMQNAPSSSAGLREIVGWSTDPEQNIPYTGETVEADLTLYAVWRDYKYVCITTVQGSERVEKLYAGETLTLSAPEERQGYRFVGWYDNADGVGTAITGVIKYIDLKEFYWAIWEKEDTQ